MTFKIGSLVCILLERWKYVSFFCGRCGGTGYAGTGNCFHCDGNGIRKERMKYVVFGGVGKITGVYATNYKTVYTVVHPFLAGMFEHADQDTRQVMDMSTAFWRNSPDGKDALTGTVTLQLVSDYVFPSYLEAINALPTIKTNIINEGIKSHGGIPGVFDENPSSTSNMKKLPPKDDGKQIVVKSKEDLIRSTIHAHSDKLWAVEYRSNVQRYMQCPRCTNEVILSCNQCHGSNKVIMYIPQYILLGMVRVSEQSGEFSRIEICPSPYVNDDVQATMSRSYWTNVENQYDSREPKKSLCLWDHLFYTVDDAKQWLKKRNSSMLEAWCKDNKMVPAAVETVRLGDDTAVENRYPKAVPIEACLC